MEILKNWVDFKGKNASSLFVGLRFVGWLLYCDGGMVTCQPATLVKAEQIHMKLLSFSPYWY